MKRILIFPVIALACTVSLYGCKSKSADKLDLSSTHTTAASTQAAPKDTMAPTTASSSTEETTEEAAKTTTAPSSALRVTSALKTYSSGNVSIQYPQVSNLTDTTLQATMNEHLKENAIAILKAYQVNETKDKVSVNCKVISVDRRQITAVYTGSVTAGENAASRKLFYTNTVDLTKGTDINLNSYIDGHTLAAYVLSDQCEFSGLPADKKAAVTEYIKTQTVEYYTDLFHKADFPLSADTAGTVFPQSFSYVDQGTAYVSIPLPETLGDYTVVTFTPETK